MPQVKKRVLKKARIEIIPLIDVIFFLLATFVLFTLSLNRMQSVIVDLPESVINPNPADVEPVIIQVSDSGTYFWNREIVTFADIKSRLDSLKKVEADPRVLVAGDQYALFGPTVELLDLVREVGIEKVSVETRVRPSGQ
jgi:biopolymer transport protein ExbD